MVEDKPAADEESHRNLDKKPVGGACVMGLGEGGEGQGACCQEEPKAREAARCSMREAKLGRVEVSLMRSEK